MAATKIMLIRHAEKPNGGTHGVDPSGERDDEDLTVRGWQRAGALARLFLPASGTFSDPRLATPHTIFASGAGKHSKSFWRGIASIQSRSSLPAVHLNAARPIVELHHQ